MIFSVLTHFMKFYYIEFMEEYKMTQIIDNKSKRNKTKRNRLSIDVLPEEQKLIKIYAAYYGITIREYVLKSIKEKLERENENKELASLTHNPSAALQEIWNNNKDAEYDKL